MKNFDVLCIADMCVDLIVSGNARPQWNQVEQLVGDYHLELGGSANIFAAQFSKLGGKAGVLGAVGEDAFGDFALQRLSTLGVDASLVQRKSNLKTGLGVALCEGDDRAILTYAGSIDATSPRDLSTRLLERTRHWHIASYFLLEQLREYWPRWLQLAKEHGVTVSLDTNFDPQDRWDGVLDLLPLVDIFLPNEREARATAKNENLTEAAQYLASRGPLVVVKCGRDGALCVTPSGEEYSISTTPIESFVDSIGAGDCFDAGFLRGHLSSWPLEKSLELACRCGAASTRAAGGIASQLQETIGEIVLA